MFNTGLDTHMTGVTRLEIFDMKRNYKILLVPFTVVFVQGTSIRARVVAYKDGDLSLNLVTVGHYDDVGRKCFCKLLGVLTPICEEQNCTTSKYTPVSLFLQKTAGLIPLNPCCSTENCLNPSYDWDQCR